MANHPGVSIARIYTTYHSQNCWAYLTGAGWKKVQTGNADGVTNVHTVMTVARGNGKVVTAITDAADSRIERVYL